MLCEQNPKYVLSKLPVIGLEHALHRLEKSWAKQSAQYGSSSLEVNLWPASVLVQFVQVKHSLW